MEEDVFCKTCLTHPTSMLQTGTEQRLFVFILCISEYVGTALIILSSTNEIGKGYLCTDNVHCLRPIYIRFQVGTIS